MTANASVVNVHERCAVPVRCDASRTCSSVLVATSTPGGRLVLTVDSSSCCLMDVASPDSPAMLFTISKPVVSVHHGIRSAMRA